MLTLLTLAIAVGCVRAPRVMMLGRQPNVFWPPPPATTVTDAPLEPSASTMGEAAAALTSRLREEGYVDVRWYPIGARYDHGFAVTTRLERIDAGAPRWPSVYPEPVELRWLERAKPEVAGHYRALLVAFTDLPAPSAPNAPIWDATTLMETGNPPGPLPTGRVAASTFRVRTFVYDYAR